MKAGTPAWSVVVVVFNGPHNILAISRNFNTRDPGFPGGDSEIFDENPSATAKRELYEETGIEAVELRCVAQWTGERNQPVFAFVVPRWRGGRLRTSDEGKPFWARPERFVANTATYKDRAQTLLETLGRLPGQETKDKTGT